MITFPLDDAEYTAAALGAWLCTRTRGVFSSDGHYSVTASGGMTITVSAGLAWLRMGDFWGVHMLEDTEQTLTLQTSHGTYNRYDAVCVRLDKNTNKGITVIKTGTPASKPTIAAPSRNNNYDEIYVATILVKAGATSITASNITDQRLNETYCGIMSDGVTSIPTQELISQWTDTISTWFEGIKGTLDSDAATNLHNLIISVRDSAYDKAAEAYTKATEAYDLANSNTFTQGTWTPTVSQASSYSVRRGWYLKIGGVVTIGFSITFVSSSTGSVVISGIPGGLSPVNGACGGGTMSIPGFPASARPNGFRLVVAGTNTYIYPQVVDSSGDTGSMGIMQTNSTNQISGSITYST